jgi:hypothetical protein
MRAIVVMVGVGAVLAAGLARGDAGKLTPKGVYLVHAGDAC